MVGVPPAGARQHRFVSRCGMSYPREARRLDRRTTGIALRRAAAEGVFNLISREVDAFDDESEHVALLFASHAAVAMSGERSRSHLLAAVSSREVIGQAQGILMERFKITAAMAFHMLMLASQHGNRKLRDIADGLVETGQLPEREIQR